MKRKSTSVQLQLPEEAEVKLIPVQNLTFDPKNSRLPSSVESGDEEAILDWMLADATIVELMGAIGEHDYFPGEPLLVVPKPNTDLYTVIEGNRRLTAVKLLLNPELAQRKKNTVKEVSAAAKYHPKELPALVFKKRDEILDYLGYRHITGIKPWESLAKAKYLEELYLKARGPDGPRKFQDLARKIGSRADYVERLLTSLNIYKRIEQAKFFDIEDLDEETIDFSFIITFLQQSEIVKFIGLESSKDLELKGLKQERLKEVTKWLFEKDKYNQTKIGESRNIRQLAKIVTNDQALRMFRSGDSLEMALRYIGKPDTAFRQFLTEAKDSLESAQKYLSQLDNLSGTDYETIREISRVAEDMRVAISNRLAKHQK